ncbi:MAG TPA: hypothetical protein DEP66_04250 [Acidimicrobiaceae bacterium]|nr:hypothetical protein [Acidimicrobiaceae bacterium]
MKHHSNKTSAESTSTSGRATTAAQVRPGRISSITRPGLGAKKNSPSSRMPAVSCVSGMATPSIVMSGCQPGRSRTPTGACRGACEPGAGTTAVIESGYGDGAPEPRIA